MVPFDQGIAKKTKMSMMSKEVNNYIAELEGINMAVRYIIKHSLDCTIYTDSLSVDIERCLTLQLLLPVRLVFLF